MIDTAVRERSDARQRSAAVCHCDCNHDFIRAGRVVDPYFHAVEMTTDESSILVAEGNVENHSQSASLLR